MINSIKTTMNQKPIETSTLMPRVEFELTLGLQLSDILRNMTPLNWSVLVAPIMPRAHSAGGIALPNSVQESEQYLTYIGKLLAVGPAYYESDALRPYRENAPKLGDYVMYKQYTGKSISYKGIKLLLMDDDQIKMVVDDIDNFRIYL